MNQFSDPGQPVRTETWSISPDRARQLLEKNTKNRSVGDSHVNRLADDMRIGAWRMNGETLKFAPDGTLLDGQHRLRAIIVSGCTVDMLVALDVQEDARPTMDSGRKRSISDHMTFNGVENAARITAICRMLGVILEQPHDSYAQVEELRERWSNDIVPVIGYIKQEKRVSVAAVEAAVVFARATDPERMDLFAHKLSSIEMLPGGHPILALRKHLTGMKAILPWAERRKLFLRVLTAAEAYLKSERGRQFFRESSSAFAKFAATHGVDTDLIRWHQRHQQEQRDKRRRNDPQD